MSAREYLGNVVEAAEKLDTDVAGIFEMYSAGELKLTREEGSTTWQVWR